MTKNGGIFLTKAIALIHIILKHIFINYKFEKMLKNDINMLMGGTQYFSQLI